MNPTALIADDHTIFLHGLRELLDPHYEIVGEATDGESLLAIAVETQPDIIISDLSMPGISGLQALQTLQEKKVSSKVVILTMHAEREYAAEAIASGASGFLLKTSAFSDLLSAMAEALRGGVYISPQLAGEVFAASGKPRKLDELSGRQRKIMELLTQGLSAKEIGKRLEISSRTVEYHKYQILRKLDLKTTADLIQFALREKLIENP